MRAMKPIRLLAVLCALIALASCYVTDKPLISDAQSVAPYAKMTFQGRDAGDSAAEFTRTGRHYTTTDNDGTVLTLNLRPDGDYYVAQLGGRDGDKDQYLYGYLRLDPDKGIATAYRTFGTKDDARDGLRACNDVICIDSLAAYITYAKEEVASGKPDTTFTLKVE
jgi:hypothetical protein